jgi:hypothetical protein
MEKLHSNLPLLSRMSDPPLLNRITNPLPLLPLPKSPISMQKLSQPVTTSLINTEKERFQKHQRTWEFRKQFLKQTELVMRMQKRVSDLLSQRLRTTTWKSQWHRGEEKNLEERNLEVSSKLPLLSRIQSTSTMTKQTGSRNLKWMRETSPGSKQESLGELRYQPVLQKPLTSYDSSVST